MNDSTPPEKYEFTPSDIYPYWLDPDGTAYEVENWHE